MNDGIALCSTAHPRLPWYRRLWFYFRPARLSPDSLETIQITVPERYTSTVGNTAVSGELDGIMQELAEAVGDDDWGYYGINVDPGQLLSLMKELRILRMARSFKEDP